MKISDICIKRPVFATVLSLVLIVIGLMSYFNLPVRFFPSYESASIRISTSYSGANAYIVENTVTTPIENAISNLSGIEYTSSESEQGSSNIEVELTNTADVQTVINDLRDKVAAIQKDFPDNVSAPRITERGDESELMDIMFYDKTQSPQQIEDFLNRYVIQKMNHIPGVSEADVFGANPYALLIDLNPIKLKQYGITSTEVAAAIQASNAQIPAGQIYSDHIDYPVTINNQLTTSQQFANIVVTSKNGIPITVSDLATVKIGSSLFGRVDTRMNGKRVVGISINMSNTDSNPLTVEDGVKQVLKNLKTTFPSSMHHVISTNMAQPMRNSVNEVYHTISIAILCVIAVIVVFLGSIRSSLVPIVTIPICLIASFAIIAAFGFTINMITLLALVLSIGLVVDDAIVVVENVYRHIQNGTNRLDAAKIGMREIGFSIVAMTLTLAAVYAPIGAIQGHHASIYRAFAFSLAGSVVISGFVALTLSPMMCSKFLSNRIQQKGYEHWLEHFFSRLQYHYQQVLGFILKLRWLVVIVLLVLIASLVPLFKSLPHNFMPSEDIGLLFGWGNNPSGSNFNYGVALNKKIQQVIANLPDTKYRFSASFSGSETYNFAAITLKDISQRQDSSAEIANRINQQLATLPGVSMRFFAPSLSGGGSGHSDIDVQLFSNDTYPELYQLSQKISEQLQKDPAILSASNSDLFINSQQYQVSINQLLAAKLGVPLANINSTINDLLGEPNITYLNYGGYQYNVLLEAPRALLDNISSLNDFYVQNNNGIMIPLGSLISVTQVINSRTLPHYNQMHSVELSINPENGYTTGQAVSAITQVFEKDLPKTVKYQFVGKAEHILEEKNTMTLIFGLALVFIYLVLSAQFESFIDPLIILTAVPLSMVGALIGLKLVNGSLNIYTDIGLVTLVGLIAKHGILITHFANELALKEQLNKFDAVLKAAAIRLRPILMTTAAMVCGTLPLLFSVGASHHSRLQIGVVIIGGLLVGTFFSLIVVPVVYTLFSRGK